MLFFLCLLFTSFADKAKLSGINRPYMAVNTGKIMAALRKEKGWNQTELATNNGVSREMIGK